MYPIDLNCGQYFRKTPMTGYCQAMECAIDFIERYLADPISESLLRPFRKEYQTNPSAYRKGREHRGLQRITVSRNPERKPGKGDAIPRQVVVRNESLFIGRKHGTTLRQDRYETDIPLFWRDFSAGKILDSIPDKVSHAAIGLYCNWDIDEGFDVLIGAQVGRLTRVPDGMVGHKAAAAK